MKIFTPMRVVTFIAALFAALSLGLGVAVAASNHPADDGVLGVFNGDQGSKACVHSRPLLERNERNVINYYRISFNDKNPQLAVRLYGGAEYIQHNPLAALRVRKELCEELAAHGKPCRPLGEPERENR